MEGFPGKAATMTLAFIIEFPEDDCVHFYHPTFPFGKPMSVYMCDGYEYEAELEENTVGYALKLMGWDSATMPLEFAVNCDETEHDAWHSYEGLQELLLRPVGLHPIAHFTIGESLAVDEPSTLDLLTDQMCTL
jgi:hypothetical protein